MARMQDIFREPIPGRPAHGTTALHLQENLGEASAVIDGEGRILRANTIFNELFERTVENPLEKTDDILGLCSGRLMEDNEAFIAWLDAQIRNSHDEARYEEPVGIRSTQGKVTWVKAYFTQFQQGQRDRTERILTFRNTTALKQAQELHLRSKEKYEELVQGVNSLIMRLDPSYRILFANRYASNLLGYPLNELVGFNLHEVLLPDESSRYDAHDLTNKVKDSAQTTKFPDGFDQECRCCDGHTIWVHWTVRALRDPFGEVRELLCVGVDITARKQAEFEAKKYRRRVRRLSQQLSRAENKERAKIADYLHDQIIQQLSLSSIQLGAILKEMEEKKWVQAEKKVEGVRTLIDDAVAQCRSVMDDLVPSYLYDLGLLPALKHLVEKLEKPVQTVITLDPPVGDLSFQNETAAWLFNAIRELLMNALKHAGAERVDIRLQKQEQLLRITVEDDGSGFDPATLDDLHPDENGGHGLFAIRERMETLGGGFHIESSPGKGTRATLLLPDKTTA